MCHWAVADRRLAEVVSKYEVSGRTTGRCAAFDSTDCNVSGRGYRDGDVTGLESGQASAQRTIDRINSSPSNNTVDERLLLTRGRTGSANENWANPTCETV